MELCGYQSAAYARAMALDGRPVQLKGARTSIVLRPIKGSELEDGFSPYPFLSCLNWDGLKSDLNSVERGIVSFTAVTDPFADVSEDTLRSTFNHIVRPYKDHFVIDLTQSAEDYVDAHHMGCARRALKKIVVEHCENPIAHLSEWQDLYAHLVRRHNIRGPSFMTEDSFRRQFEVPGVAMFRALKNGVTCGMIICLRNGSDAYFHLGAYNEDGYRSKASYALIWSIIQHYTALGLKRLNIGAGAGAVAGKKDGLTLFKSGWANGTLTTYLCGSIFDIEAYQKLTAAQEIATTSYFPAYRSGEYR